MTAICPEKCTMVDFCPNIHHEALTENVNELFQALYENNKSSIYKFFYYKTNKNSSLADDLTQETFLRVYRNLNKITALCNVIGWVHVIANNIFIDYQRKQQRMPLTGGLLNIDSLNRNTEIEDTPCQILLRSIQRQNLQNIYESLPPRYCTAIYLKEYQCLTYAEAADVMNLSLAAYTSLLNRARNKFKEAVIARIFDVDEDKITKNEYSSFSKWLEHIHSADDISKPIEKDMQTYFNDRAVFYNQTAYWDYHALIDEYILSKYPLQKGHHAADFGMGTGIFASKLSRYVKQVDGYDYSKEMCDQARRNFLDHNIDNVACHHLDFTDTADIPKNYDYAYCVTVLHHMTYPQKAVKIFADKLKTGGGLVISDFYKHKCTELAEERKDLWYGFTKEQFKTFLTNAGLKNVWVEVHKEFPMKFRTKAGKIIKIPTIIGGGEK